MEITLSRENQKLVEDRLRRREFRSADEMIERALRLLVEREKEFAREKREIRALLDERGKQSKDPATVWLDGEQVFAELEAEIDEYEKNRGV